MGMNSFIFLAVEAETIRTALLNTVMCISIVFILLFVFSWAISLFKYISKAESHFKNKNSSEPAPVPVSEPEEAEEIYEEELSDDSELVAVITAAIYAYEQSMEAQSPKEIIVPADGLVVRSIRKVNKSGWQNA